MESVISTENRSHSKELRQPCLPVKRTVQPVHQTPGLASVLLLDAFVPFPTCRQVVALLVGPRVPPRNHLPPEKQVTSFVLITRLLPHDPNGLLVASSVDAKTNR
ncbi:unnamed protein product [Schistocephalus solidus]|uniref:Uncharacterized protein n=1 Tax=Schistocephalus solidus TaxID=70667 RepID=A0A183T9C3_SCHSO|nr:unnamed protein product [Schistocephalus solidus]